MTQVNGDALYARVDVVESSRGPLLMELELIEPELYFLYSSRRRHDVRQRNSQTPVAGASRASRERVSREARFRPSR